MSIIYSKIFNSRYYGRFARVVSTLKVLQGKGRSSSQSSLYSFSEDGFEIKEPDINSKIRITTLGSKFTEYFLPRGYPLAISSRYLPYAIGQNASIIFSTIGGVLSMQSLLQAIGLGANEAIPVAAALNWVIKDGLGQLGGVLFASFVNNKFDSDPRKWRFLACAAMDGASFIELLTPLAPGYFLFLASFANIGKNISFLASSASRAAINKSFAWHENLADITAKTGSQAIISSMIGTALGVSVSASLAYFTDSSLLSMALTFLSCSGLSLASLHWSLRHVNIQTLSPERLQMIVNHWLDQVTDGSYKSSSILPMLQSSVVRNKAMVSPDIYYSLFPSILFPSMNSTVMKLHIGTRIHYLTEILSSNDIKNGFELFKNKLYAIFPDSQKKSIHLLLHESAQKKDIVEGLVLASIVARYYQHAPSITSKEISEAMSWSPINESLSDVRTVVEMLTELIVDENKTTPRNHWIIEEMLLETNRARYDVV